MQTKLNQAIISAIAEIQISDERVVFWDKKDTGILRFMLAKKVVSKRDLLDAIDERLRNIGRQIYRACIRHNQSLDHSISPEAFAYALKNGEFTDEEKSCIQFDHGDTFHTFIKGYNRGNLKQKILNQLIAQK